jgi:hypothetical protein
MRVCCSCSALFEYILTQTLDLNSTLAYHDTNSIKNQIKFEHYSGRIEVTHFEESNSFMTFSGLQGHRTSVSALDPQLQALGDDQFAGPSQEVYLLDADSDDIPSKLEMYIKKNASYFYERETSPFMKPTLLLAAELNQGKKVCYLTLNVETYINMATGYPSGTCVGAVGRDPYSRRHRTHLENLLQPYFASEFVALPFSAIG